MEILSKKGISTLETSEFVQTVYIRTWMIWSNFLTASLLGVPACMTPLSPLPSSASLYPGISDVDLVCELEPSSLGLFVLVGFVLGDEAGDAVTGGGRGC